MLIHELGWAPITNTTEVSEAEHTEGLFPLMLHVQRGPVVEGLCSKGILPHLTALPSPWGGGGFSAAHGRRGRAARRALA